ncbi:MAG TPA: acetolactate synthase [Solirubrobacteraceae bacterium]|jgi:acetolactate synthase-1/2/3 large subunit|nr:acetolactate synthase [Solirubrobacteraceae bacterium]
MATETETQVHGGRLIAQRLRAHGVTKLFTLSGGHIFPIYDGCREEGIDIVDVRHEQSAVFAAEGWAKVTRTIGVAALTAGPGVTNGMSAIASSSQNHSPVLILGGRAPRFRWGQGSLQEIDHVPFVRPLVKLAATSDGTAEIPGLVDEAIAAATAPPSGPAFLDFPLDHVFGQIPGEGSEEGAGAATGRDASRGPGADVRAIERASGLLREAERPVIMAGTGLYWGHGEQALLALAQELRIPVFLNGLARGCVPADHELFFSRARGAGLSGADVALVIGVPLDFRLGFGATFGAETEIVVIDAAEPERDHPRPVAGELYGALPATLGALASGAAGGGAVPAREQWIASLRAIEAERRAAEADELADPRAPLHPMRVYAELAQVLDRNAIIVCDGGDFVSYAGRMVEVYEPGSWLDPGPFGCLGSGPGYALAAKLAHPHRQVVLLVGDGAFGFSGLEYDTLARHGVNVVGVMGNNGIWALEKHPMESLYGYSVAAELRPQTRYDLVVEALGGHAELVRTPDELRPALVRAFEAGKPALVNVITDPSVAYPRKTNLG